MVLENGRGEEILSKNVNEAWEKTRRGESAIAGVQTLRGDDLRKNFFGGGGTVSSQE